MNHPKVVKAGYPNLRGFAKLEGRGPRLEKDISAGLSTGFLYLEFVCFL